MSQICDTCCRRSVVRRLLSVRGHISKTEQDRSIANTEHYWEFGIADTVAAFRSSPDAPLWEIFEFQISLQNMCKISASCSTLRQTTAVVNRARPSSRRRCGQLQLYSSQSSFVVLAIVDQDSKISILRVCCPINHPSKCHGPT